MLNSVREVCKFREPFKYHQAIVPSVPSSNGLKDALAAISLVSEHVQRIDHHLHAIIDVLQPEASVDAMQQEGQYVEEGVVSAGFQHLAGN